MEVGTVCIRVIVAPSCIGSSLIFWMQIVGAERRTCRDSFGFVPFRRNPKKVKALKEVFYNGVVNSPLNLRSIRSGLLDSG